MGRQRIRLTNPVTGTESLDLIARKVLMASILYYGLGISIISDDQFDRWCKKLAKRWHKLDRFKQWQLGSPEQIRVSGFHFHVTHANVGGALAWLHACGQSRLQHVCYTQEWKWSKRYKVRYLAPENFAWRNEMIKKPKRRKRVRL